jgi:hypothetical protein
MEKGIRTYTIQEKLLMSTYVKANSACWIVVNDMSTGGDLD